MFKNSIVNRCTWPVMIIIIVISMFDCELRAQDNEDFNGVVKKVALKTNILYDGTLIPNLGAEVAFQNDWSLCANWFYAWWQHSDRARFWDIYGGELDVRKWFGKRAMDESLLGHHAGVYMMFGTYDFKKGRYGYQSDFSYNFGVSYGYAVKIARNLSLDFVIGLGYLGGRFHKYKAEYGEYCIVKTKQKNFFGPTKAEVSLVWSMDGFIKSLKGDKK